MSASGAFSFPGWPWMILQKEVCLNFWELFSLILCTRKVSSSSNITVWKHSYLKIIIKAVVGQIAVKNSHNTAFYEEELKFCIVMEKAMKSKTDCGPDLIDHDYVIQREYAFLQ